MCFNCINNELGLIFIIVSPKCKENNEQFYHTNRQLFWVLLYIYLEITHSIIGTSITKVIRKICTLGSYQRIQSQSLSFLTKFKYFPVMLCKNSERFLSCNIFKNLEFFEVKVL